MVAVLFYFAVTTENFVLKNVADPAVKVNVRGGQVALGFATTAPSPLDEPGQEVHTIGTANEVPIPRTAGLRRRSSTTLQSRDVIHSFWVPDFLFKRDVFPDPKANNSQNVFPEQHRQSRSHGRRRCAELCGTSLVDELKVRGVPRNVYLTIFASGNR